MDVEWCPYISTVFANVAKDGRLELWDLEYNAMDSCISIKPSDEVKHISLCFFNIFLVGSLACKECCKILQGKSYSRNRKCCWRSRCL